MGIYTFKHFPQYIYLVGTGILLLAGIIELIYYVNRRKSHDDLLVRKTKRVDTDSNEYHNDFSKVPAGPVIPEHPIDENLKKDLDDAGIEIRESHKKP